MCYKLEVDYNTLGPPKTQFNYVYSRLRGAAQNMAILFSEMAAQIGQYNPNGLLNYLKKYYTNPDINQRALEYLCRIRQGENEPFTIFFPRFERELIENDRAILPDYFEILYLKEALNVKITDYLITINPDRQNYPYFIRVIQ